MLTIVTLAGLAIGVIVFLNLLHSREILQRRPAKQYTNKMPPSTKNPAKLLNKSINRAQARPRICPLCGTLLSKEDYLLAALAPEPNGGGKRQAQIYGCRYCYETDGVNIRGSELLEMEP